MAGALTFYVFAGLLFAEELSARTLWDSETLPTLIRHESLSIF